LTSGDPFIAPIVQLTNVFVVEQQLRSYGAYVQDDWKVSDKFTVNLGVRYDYMTPATEKNNRMANFDPATRGLVFAKDGSIEDRALVKPDRNNFSPRVGATYKLNDRTILRGGFGIFYNQFDRIGSEDQRALNPPGPGQNRRAGCRRQRGARPALAGRVPGQFSRSSEPASEERVRERILRACAAHLADPTDQRYFFWDYYVRRHLA
jgi:hypothetical protein